MIDDNVSTFAIKRATAAGVTLAGILRERSSTPWPGDRSWPCRVCKQEIVCEPWTMVKRLLILGGTAEARKLAGLVVDSLAGKVEAVTSLVEHLEPMPELPGRVRTGGFEDIQALVDYLRQEAVDMVIDATHPFAEVISANAYAACLRAEVPRLMLIRPPWRLPPASRWVEVDDLTGAAEILPRLSRRAFLT
ncbi:MAG: precorrin-6A/cobalt-precorrin-6A reductase, partial [Rhodospirillales bacterium]